MARTRLGIVDDHPLFRVGIRSVVAEMAVDIVGEASTRSEAVALARSCDLLTLDLSLEDVAGTSLLEQLTSLGTGARILVVSMLDEDLYAERCVRLGASGYLAKTEAPRALIRALETVRRGDIHLSAHVLRQVAHRLASGGAVQDPVGALSSRELEVFRLMGRGERSVDIAEILHLSPKTVEAHQAKLRRKLGVDNMLQLRRRAMAWSIEGDLQAG